MSLAPRVVLVTRRTELEELLERHGTRGQAEFALAARGRGLAEVQERHDALTEAVRTVSAAVPLDWRRGAVERADLPRFLFAAEDVVVVVGQDGLVANVAGYLDGQPVVGVDGEPGRNPGVLVTHRPAAAAGLLRAAVAHPAVEERVMVQATTDDGQVLRALNEVYLGHPGHQTARYRITPAGGQPERQASSGVLVGTGTGATGWCGSVARERAAAAALPGPTQRRLVWFVREAWASPGTSTRVTAGEVTDEPLLLDVESDRLVAFGDGIEDDALELRWGRRVELAPAARTLRLVV
ncbi:NAD(+)/NADH kinase [Rhodococcus aerolatus]